MHHHWWCDRCDQYKVHIYNSQEEVEIGGCINSERKACPGMIRRLVGEGKKTDQQQYEYLIRGELMNDKQQNQ